MLKYQRIFLQKFEEYKIALKKFDLTENKKEKVERKRERGRDKEGDRERERERERMVAQFTNLFC